MHIVVVAINEVDSFISGQVIVSLLHCQPKLASELRYENQRPFYFIGIVIHDTPEIPRKSSAKKRLYEKYNNLFVISDLVLFTNPAKICFAT